MQLFDNIQTCSPDLSTGLTKHKPVPSCFESHINSVVISLIACHKIHLDYACMINYAISPLYCLLVFNFTFLNLLMIFNISNFHRPHSLIISYENVICLFAFQNGKSDQFVNLAELSYMKLTLILPVILIVKNLHNMHT